MKVEAVKVENGFLIPFNDVLKNVDRDKILLQVEIIERPDTGEDQIEKTEDSEPQFPKDFWASPSLDELAEMQNVKPIEDVSVLFGTWPGEIDDGFEEAIYELRHQDDTKSGLL